jgi:hypothetical protein
MVNRKVRKKAMKATFGSFKISSVFTGSKEAPWSKYDRNLRNRNHHTVSVTNTDNGKRTRFSFWASIAQPELRSKYDVLNAFYCFVSDALSGDMLFNDFCSEFGFDDPDQSLRTWRDCQRSAKQLQRIFPGDICDLVNDLSEVAG